MYWTIHKSQCVITTFLSDPRSTLIFSHWGSLLRLSAYAVEIKIHKHDCVLIVIFFTLWCACYSAFRSETWSTYTVLVEILSAEHVKAGKIWYNTDTLHRLTIKRHSSQALPYHFSPDRKQYLYFIVITTYYTILCSPLHLLHTSCCAIKKAENTTKRFNWKVTLGTVSFSSFSSHHM